jgi:hypothetical protein
MFSLTDFGLPEVETVERESGHTVRRDHNSDSIFFPPPSGLNPVCFVSVSCLALCHILISLCLQVHDCHVMFFFSSPFCYLTKLTIVPRLPFKLLQVMLLCQL